MAPATATKHRRHLPGDPRQHEEHDEHSDADRERLPDRLIEVAEELLQLFEERVGVGREPEELRQLADDDRDRQPVHVADLHLARQQVGDEAEPREPGDDLDDPDEEGEHPGELDRPRRAGADDQQRRQRGEDHRRDR